MIFVIGGRGRLGSALFRSYPCAEVQALDRAIYQNWYKKNSPDAIARFFEPWRNQPATIFVAAGILDPRRPLEEHMDVNYYLAKNIIEGACKHSFCVVTFGSVMEELIKKQNFYIQSKTALGKFVSSSNNGSQCALHIRLHTLYGIGLPSSFIFLGQIYHAIKNKIPFKMTEGKQLREYHHVDDEVLAIKVLLDKKMHGVINLSHGEPLSLSSMAHYIFDNFNLSHLLKVGVLPEPNEENYGTLYSKTSAFTTIKFRKTLPALVTYLRSCEQENEA